MATVKKPTFEKSKKDKELKGSRESPREEALDKKEMAMKRGGKVKK